MPQVGERAKEEPRADHERQRQRHLSNHQQVSAPQSTGTAPAARRWGALLQIGSHVEPGHLHSWRQAEQQRRDERDGRGEGENGRIEPDVKRHRLLTVREEHDQRAAAPHRQQQADKGAGCGVERSLCEQLPEQPRPWGAYRQADAHLLSTACRPREQQRGKETVTR